MKLYREYRRNPDTAINAKYAAMLYVRCAQVNYKLSVDAGVIDASTVIENLYKNALNFLASHTDRDLTVKVENADISIPADVDTPPNTSPTIPTTTNEKWHDLGEAEKIWECTWFIADMLNQNSKVKTIEPFILIGYSSEISEDGDFEWELGGTTGDIHINGEPIDIDDMLASEGKFGEYIDYDLSIYVSANDYTISLFVGPAKKNGSSISFGKDNGNWWDSLSWVYDWNGNLLHSDTDLDLADGLFYAMEQSK